MNNRINEISCKISSLRLRMLAEQVSVREQVNQDLDCTEAALRLLAMRTDLSALLREWKAAGGGDRLPTIRERPMKGHGPVQRSKPAPMPKIQKRRLLARA
jgi:hypothetical protein